MNNKQNQTLLGILLLIILMLVIGLVAVWRHLPNPSPTPVVNIPPVTIPVQTQEGMTQAMCEQARGHWVGCAAGDQTCKPECKCGGIAGWSCPTNFACTDYVPNAQTPDAMGVCHATSSVPVIPMQPATTTASPTTTVIDIPGRRTGMLCDETDSICISDKYKDQTITNPLMVTGTAIAFENQFAWKLIDGNGATEIMSGTAMANAPDVGQPGPFQIRAFFPATYVTHAGEATLVLYEASARDGSPIHVLRVPMKLSALSTTIKIQAAWPNAQNDCTKTRTVTMTIPRTNVPIEASIRRLLELKPTMENPEQMTVIPQGTQLISLSVVQGVAKLVFSPELENHGGGSCNVTAIRSQIEKTLQVFPSIHQVSITVQGKTPETTLQP